MSARALRACGYLAKNSRVKIFAANLKYNRYMGQLARDRVVKNQRAGIDNSVPCAGEILRL